MEELLLHSPFIIYSQLQSGSVEKLIKYLFTITKWFTYVWNGAIRSCHDTSVLMILNFLYHHRIVTIQINKVFLFHIDFHETWSFGIICRNSKMLLLFGRSKNFLIVGMHLCLQLLKWHFEFGKENEGFLVIFQNIILKWKKSSIGYNRSA